jgi:3-hydroxyisobutyrate dehydrogenase-like beta-hydroxyacid dehydrogenase
MPTLAFLGLGAMGAPMARNLAAAGFVVRAWNRSPEKFAGYPELVRASSPADACRGASLVVSMLADDAAVNAVTFGPNGVLDALEPGAVHIGMSTVSVACTTRLVQAHAERGHGYVAAPVFGRPEAAKNRLLFIVPGGSEADLTRAATVFAAVGQGVFPMGTAPQASVGKLAGNFLIAATIESLGEAFTLAEKSGVPPARLLEMLTGTLFGSPLVKGYGQRMVSGAFVPPGFTIRLGLKDVNLALAAAEAVDVPMPLAELAQSRMETAIERGRGEIDFAGFVTVIREEAGLE